MIIAKTELAVKIKHLEEVIEMAQDLAHFTLAESNCLTFEVYIRVEQPGNLVLLHQWGQDEDYEKYLQEAPTVEFFEAIAECLSAPIKGARFVVEKAEVDEVSPLAEEGSQVFLGEEVTVH